MEGTLTGYIVFRNLPGAAPCHVYSGLSLRRRKGNSDSSRPTETGGPFIMTARSEKKALQYKPARVLNFERETSTNTDSAVHGLA